MKIKLDEKIPISLKETLVVALITVFLGILPILCTHPIISLTFFQGILVLIPFMTLLNVVRYVYLVKVYNVFLSENNRKKIFQNIIIIESALLQVVYAILVALYIMCSDIIKL